MNKNKQTNFFSIFIIINIIIILGIGLFLWKNHTSPNLSNDNYIINENGVKEFSKDFDESILMSDIISQSEKYDDYKKCSQLKTLQLKENCEAQIKFRFNEINTVSASDECAQLKADESYSQEHRQDVCYLNYNTNKSLNKEESKEICKKIKNVDLRDLCQAQGEIKFGK